MKRSLIIGIVALGVFVTACGDDSDDGAAAATTTTIAVETTTPPTTAEATTTTTAAETTTTVASDVVVVAVSGSELGEILTDGEGNTLYLFVPDEQGDSVCYDDCAAAWPPVTGPAEAGDGVDDSLLGGQARTDGTEQVTYNGWPLYYFAADAVAGDTKGQGVNDVWYVVDAAGDAIS